jgi:two-component system, NarL family, nitrate/nitrite response regulator NarL
MNLTHALNEPHFLHIPYIKKPNAQCVIKFAHFRLTCTIYKPPPQVERAPAVSEIELFLRSQLVTEALSAILTEAGFAISCKENPNNDGIITVIDFDILKDQEAVRAHQLRGVKVVALAGDGRSLEISPDEIAALSGVLTYDLSADTFVQSLRLICSGERVFPRDMAFERAPAAQASAKPSSDGVRLSPREREVLAHLVEGHSNKVIARHLGMTEATAKVHLKSVLRKIRVENRTQAAVWALSNLPELDPAPRGFV